MTGWRPTAPVTAYRIRSYNPDVPDFEIEDPYTIQEAANKAAELIHEPGWEARRQDGPVDGDGHFVPVISADIMEDPELRANVKGPTEGRMFHISKVR